MRDCGSLDPVRHGELAQDVQTTWTLAVLTLMTSAVGDLAVGVAAGDEGQDLRLARRQAEDLLQALLRVG